MGDFNWVVKIVDDLPADEVDDIGRRVDGVVHGEVNNRRVFEGHLAAEYGGLEICPIRNGKRGCGNGQVFILICFTINAMEKVKTIINKFELRVVKIIHVTKAPNTDLLNLRSTYTKLRKRNILSKELAI